MELVQQLEELFQQKQQGLLSEEEFQAQKTRLLEQQLTTTHTSPTKSIKEIYKDYWRKSFVWRGRASRSEFWWPMAINQIISICFASVAMLSVFAPTLTIVLVPFNIASTCFNIANLFPSWAVYVRRFHDLGKSAWFAFAPVLLALVLALFAGVSAVLRYAQIEMAPKASSAVYIAGGIALIYFGVTRFIYTCLSGTQGDNEYGTPRV